MGLFDMRAFYSSILFGPSLLEEDSDKRTLEETFVALFETRDIRGGMGQRHASMTMWKQLLDSPEYQPKMRALALDLLDLVPEYGCWQDMFKMPQSAWPRCLEIVEKQFLKDELALANGGKLSLLAKWMPREGQLLATECALKLVPGQMFLTSRMKLYRKRVARLNIALNTVEVKMCANDWANIYPTKVPQGALKKYKKAFLNERANGILRRPNSEGRMACRENFRVNFSETPRIHQMVGRYDLVRDRVRAFLAA